MTGQASLPLSQKRSRLDVVAGYFLTHENEWVSAMTLLELGGACAWRTRVSDCRRMLRMEIENKTERQADGTLKSFYRYRRSAA
jgi:hypothetical protein